MKRSKNDYVKVTYWGLDNLFQPDRPPINFTQKFIVVLAIGVYLIFRQWSWLLNRIFELSGLEYSLTRLAGERAVWRTIRCVLLTRRGKDAQFLVIVLPPMSMSLRNHNLFFPCLRKLTKRLLKQFLRNHLYLAPPTPKYRRSVEVGVDSGIIQLGDARTWLRSRGPSELLPIPISEAVVTITLLFSTAFVNPIVNKDRVAAAFFLGLLLQALRWERQRVRSKGSLTRKDLPHPEWRTARM